MRKLILIGCLLAGNMVAQVPLSPNTINALDSVVFDISQSVISPGYVEFPVSFISDDTIYAVDFSFRYNQQNFVFDSIINLNSGLVMLYNYNANDSTVRMTSYNLQPIANNNPVVNLRFQVLTGVFCVNDMYNVKVYLNGDVCSKKFLGCNTTNISELNPTYSEGYPNPTSGNFYIDLKEKTEVKIFNSMGKLVEMQSYQAGKAILNFASYPSGMYYYSLEQNGKNYCGKILKY
jgi:hypothetical protein